MDTQEIVTAVLGALDAREAEKVAAATQLTAIKAAAKAEAEAELAARVPAWKGGFATKSVTKAGFSQDDNQSFSHYLRTGDIVAAKAALAEGSSSTGGVLVPNDFYAQIVSKRNEMSIARRAGVRVFQTSRDTLDIPIEGTSTTTFVATNEAASVDENEPLLEVISIPVIKWTKMAKVSNELVEDDASNLEEFLALDFAEKMAMTENRYITTGTGSGQHLGLSSSDYLNAGIPAEYDFGSEILLAGVPGLLYTLANEYRERGVWLMNSKTESFIRSIASSTWFQYSAGVTSASGPGYRLNDLLGLPVYNQKDIKVSSDSTSDAPVATVVIGDMSRYALVERAGLEVVRDASVYRANDQTGFFAKFRQGGAPLHAEAFVRGIITPNA